MQVVKIRPGLWGVEHNGKILKTFKKEHLAILYSRDSAWGDTHKERGKYAKRHD